MGARKLLYQRQELDNEIKGEGNSINYKYRMHEPRVGRFFAVDPLAWKYSYNSPYVFSENRLIDGIELEGLEYIRADEVADPNTGETFRDWLGDSGYETIEKDGELYYKVGIDIYRKQDGLISFSPDDGAKLINRYFDLEDISFNNKVSPINNSQAVGWNSMDGECFDKAKAQGKKIGVSVEPRNKNMPSNQDVWVENKGDKNISNGRNTGGVSYNSNLQTNILEVQKDIENGGGAIFGLNHDYKQSVGNTNSSTQHFVFVYGMGSDEKGNYFLVAENARSGSKAVLNSANKFYIKYDESIGWYIEGGTTWNSDMRVTEIRLQR